MKTTNDPPTTQEIWEAMRVLRSIRTERRRQAARRNGKKGGRPRKEKTPVAMPVKTEAEHRQDACIHLLVPISERTKQELHEDGKRDYEYECLQCGRALKNLNGVLLLPGDPRRDKYDSEEAK